MIKIDMTEREKTPAELRAHRDLWQQYAGAQCSMIDNAGKLHRAIITGYYTDYPRVIALDEFSIKLEYCWSTIARIMTTTQTFRA